MASVFFNKADYRAALRDPFGSMRAHAVCRQLPSWAHAAWRMACERVQSIRDAALALKNSNLW